MELIKSDKIVEEAISADLRAKNCLVDIQKILVRWNCRINPMIEISGMGIKCNFQVVPLQNIPNMGDGDGRPA